MGHIFISYSHKDKKYVEKLEKKLLDEGFDVWIDHRIDYGSRWTKEIEKAIDACDAYIIIMSKNSKESHWVEREKIHAEKRRKQFFPLLLSGEDWFSLGNIQFVDVRGGKLPPADFYEDIAKFVPRKAEASSVGAGTSSAPASRPKPKEPLLVGGIALGVLLLALLGVMLKNIFSEPDPPVEVALETFAVPAITEKPTESLLSTVTPSLVPTLTSLPSPVVTLSTQGLFSSKVFLRN